MEPEKLLNINELLEIYSISNTPRFFLDEMRANSSVQNLLKFATVDEVILRFKAIAKEKIASHADFVTLYGLYIAISFEKNFEKVKDFYLGEGKIKTQWFPAIRETILLSKSNYQVHHKDFQPIL